MRFTNRAEIIINLDNLNNNINVFKKNLSSNTKIMAVVKTDAYGHGSVAISKYLEKNDDIIGFGVATVQEGIQLRNNEITKPILVLGATFDDEIEESINNNLINNIYDFDTAEKISKCAVSINKKAKVHISVDTGMSRLGFQYNDTNIDTIVKISKLPNIELEGIFSHFARADESDDNNSTLAQIKVFNDYINALEEKGISFKYKHISNSAGAINYPSGGFDFIRLGIGMYGINPSDTSIKLKPVLSLKSKVIYVKEIMPGTPVSYGGTFVSEKNMKIATVPIGYGDGIPRTLSNKGYFLINGQKANILGRVCMDHVLVDVSDISDVKKGDDVTIIGNNQDNNISVLDIEKLSGRFYYEILCLLNKRILRTYYLNNKCVSEADYFSLRQF